MVNKQSTKTTKATAQGKKKQTLDWITSAAPPVNPFVTIDRQERIYLNVASQTLLDGAKKIIVGYDPATASLHVVDATKFSVPGVAPFKLDSRNYAKASVLVERLRLDVKNLPQHFDYIGENVTEGITSHVFKRRA